VKKQHLVILTPVYNDWTSLNILINNIKKIFTLENVDLNFVIVNDCSTISRVEQSFQHHNLHIVNLTNNIGHQRSIACGLCYIKDNFKCDKIIVMDSDGEDDPNDLINLVEGNSEIVFARRVKRSENIKFKILYFFYKILFKILTSKSVNFGNYSCLSYNVIDKLVYDDNLWNNYAATILKSKMIYKTIPTNRGVRYDGESKMTISSLLIHAFSAISVYMDLVAIRLVIFSFFTIILSFIFICLVTILKIYTNMTIPGWTTNITLLLFIILFQSLMFALLMLFIYLSKRTTKNIIPYMEYKTYISSITKY
jgi:hypothetical protein